MTFKEYCDQHALGAAQREVLWACLLYVRRRALARELIAWLRGGDDG